MASKRMEIAKEQRQGNVQIQSLSAEETQMWIEELMNEGRQNCETMEMAEQQRQGNVQIQSCSTEETQRWIEELMNEGRQNCETVEMAEQQRQGNVQIQSLDAEEGGEEDSHDEIDEESDVSVLGQSDSNLREVWIGAKKKAAKERKTERKPYPKLGEVELTGPKGLGPLRTVFSCFQPSASLGPYANLDSMLSKMEAWAHNLYPPLNFDDFLKRVEPLGRKRRVRMAMGLLRCGGTLLDLDTMLARDEGIIRDELDEDFIDDSSTAAAGEMSANPSAPSSLNYRHGLGGNRLEEDECHEDMVIPPGADSHSRIDAHEFFEELDQSDE